MKIQAVKGTRDLYPELLAPIRRIVDTWRSVSLRHGFEEYEGPTLEFLDLYREKSGEELVGQLYHLTDSGGRELALRPEMTPTLARMVAARIHTLPRPIKWFSIPTMFRGENVQRGRLREFLQWNVDVIGTSDVVADAECILVGVEALRELGLTADDFAVHISSRRLIRSVLLAGGIEEKEHDAAYALMDKADRLEREELARRWSAAYGGRIGFAELDALLGVDDLASLRAAVGRVSPSTGALEEAIDETHRLITILDDFGITELCKLDLHVVRGLAYYTGPVFEFYDRSKDERALCGGGRYDDLLGRLGKSPEPAVGFGMGDVVLGLLLKEKGLLAAPRRRGGSVLVTDAAEGLRPKVHQVVAGLRRAGIDAEFSYTWRPLGKQLKAADKRGASTVVIIGSETVERGVVQIKDMVGGHSLEASLDALLANPREVLKVTE
ncbi:MAG: histidine--tRNA ligase [Phycisphaerae bacterium]|nr:histidine--tRNA ligase [Phycisphaerae bacterium]